MGVKSHWLVGCTLTHKLPTYLRYCDMLLLLDVPWLIRWRAALTSLTLCEDRNFWRRCGLRLSCHARQTPVDGERTYLAGVVWHDWSTLTCWEYSDMLGILWHALSLQLWRAGSIVTSTWCVRLSPNVLRVPECWTGFYQRAVQANSACGVLTAGMWTGLYWTLVTSWISLSRQPLRVISARWIERDNNDNMCLHLNSERKISLAQYFMGCYNVVTAAWFSNHCSLVGLD